MEYKEIEQQSKHITGKITSIYNSINECNSNLLPPKSEEFKRLSNELNSNTIFDIVVCGEVKKGKSSFINAVIGTPLLPVDMRVATSQVFRVVNGKEEKYELVFVDGTRKELKTREELNRYGSQIAADEEGMPEFNSAVDYIEVQYPMEFLPQNVAIVDTPGIGAIYADHERVTRRYLKNAAAVVYIMDPQSPLTQPEVDFIKSALTVTDRIVFVMTKMDNYDEDYIVNMVRRNTDILNPFASKVQGGAIEILPMSSSLLASVSQADNEMIRQATFEDSQFSAVKEAMVSLSYSVVGLEKNIAHTNILIDYNRQVVAALKELNDSANNNTVAQNLIQQKQSLQQNFASEWGPQSDNYRNAQQRIADVSNSIPTRFSSMCGQSARVITSFENEIANLPSRDVDNARAYAKEMPSRLQSAIEREARNILDSVEEEINDVLGQYAHDIKHSLVLDGNAEGVFALTEITSKDEGLSKSLGKARMSYMTIGMSVAIGSIFGPIGTVIGAIVGIIAAVFMSKEQKVDKVRQECRTYLQKTMNAAFSKYCQEITPGTSLTYCGQLQRNVKTQAEQELRSIFNDHKKVIDQQIAELNNQIAADTQSRQKRLNELATINNQWSIINGNLVELKKDIVKFEKMMEA